MAANLQGYARRKWREQGYYVEAGEHVFRGGGQVRRRDTFGFADLICVRPGNIVFLQVTSWGNVSSRVNKIAREAHGEGQWQMPMAEIAKWLISCAGVRVVVEGWKKDDRNRWVSREVEVTPALLDEKGT